MKFSIPVATGAFVFYSVLSGVTLSPIFIVYTGESIASTFFITAATFGAMAAFGYFTKRDLSKVGSYLYMALIGLIIATLVNLFLKSDTLMWIISYVGVLILSASRPMIADDQSLWSRNLSAMKSVRRRFALLGALHLYLDFINLFLYLLRILGRRN